MEQMILASKEIERLAEEAGFDLCGVTRAEHLSSGEEHFREWLERGWARDLEYLHRNQELRFDPSRLVEGGRSVVVCAMNYKSELSLDQDLSGGVAIASYALMRDYHKTIKKRLKGLLKELQMLYPGLNGRAFTDSAPLLEKSLAVRAGLGWIGRQSLVVTPEYGTFVLLGELVLGCEVDCYNECDEVDRCGACRRCVDACPVGAIGSDRKIDTRLCVACRTIEVDDYDGEDLSGWIFGCELCQRVCPHNRITPISIDIDTKPRFAPPTREEWLEMEPLRFEELTAGTPLRRSSLARIRRFLAK